MPEDNPSHPTRRLFMTGGVFAVAAGGLFAANWFNVFADTSGGDRLTVTEAHRQAEAGQIYLIDIRRPDEWKRTGIAAPALPLDMRRKDFEEVLQSLLASGGDKPVALICARGVRSAHMDKRLRANGFTSIIDVPEGMLGSGAGPGYLRENLPLRAATVMELAGKVAWL